MKGIVAYLNFDGNCREAMEFYQQCLGGELNVMTFGDAQGDFQAPPGSENRVMHAYLGSGDLRLMASDTMPGMPYRTGNSVQLNLECESDEEVDSLFRALSEGGQPKMPPEDAFWGARFGMLTDRFGIDWMLNHQKAPMM